MADPALPPRRWTRPSGPARKQREKPGEPAPGPEPARSPPPAAMAATTGIRRDIQRGLARIDQGRNQRRSGGRRDHKPPCQGPGRSRGAQNRRRCNFRRCNFRRGGRGVSRRRCLRPAAGRGPHPRVRGRIPRLSWRRHHRAEPQQRRRHDPPRRIPSGAAAFPRRRRDPPGLRAPAPSRGPSREPPPGSPGRGPRAGRAARRAAAGPAPRPAPPAPPAAAPGRAPAGPRRKPPLPGPAPAPPPRARFRMRSAARPGPRSRGTPSARPLSCAQPKARLPCLRERSHARKSFTRARGG